MHCHVKLTCEFRISCTISYLLIQLYCFFDKTNSRNQPEESNRKVQVKYKYRNEFQPIRGANDGFLTWNKWYVPSESRMMFFHVWENDTSNQKPQRDLSLAPKTPAFSCNLQRLFAQIHWEKVFSLKKWKTLQNLAWNSFVCFTLYEEKFREPAKQ